MKYRDMLLASAVLQAGVANGMGLGSIEVQSFLGAPLHAQAQLISAREFGESQIRANIARVDVYDRFGARFQADHSNLRFNVVESNGELALKITSPQRIVEPFLDIVVELSWPEGTTYRRYNLLIDPPEYAARWRKQPVQAQPVEVASKRLLQVPQPVAAQAVIPDIALEGEYRVQSGDSLWKIAKRARKNTGLSIQQMMDVIYTQNPTAFINGEKAKIKLGALVAIPQGPLGQELNQAIAQTEPAPPKPALNALDTQSYAHTELAGVAEALPTQPQVVATPAMQAPPTQVVTVPTTPDATQLSEMEQLKRQLAQLQQERKELVAFQQSVKAEIAEFKGEREQLKQALLVAEEAKSATLAQITPPKAEVITNVAPQERMQSEPTSTAMVVSQPKAKISNATFSDIEAQQAKLNNSNTLMAGAAQDLIGPRSHPSDALVNRLGHGLWVVLGLIPLGMLIVFLGMRAHRVQEIRRSEAIKDEDLYDLVFGAKRDRNNSDSPEQIERAIHQIREKAGHFEHHEESPDQELDDEHLASKDDVSQMIELYMLYSQYQKALNVILTEISKRPTRKDLRLYLMQVYAHMQDWRSFEDQMEVLQRMGDEGLIKKAQEIRMTMKGQDQQRNAS